jgi:hypothetical protein
METQTVTLLLCLAAQAATGLCVRALAWFLYSDLPSPGPSWAALRVYQVHTAPWPAIVPQLGQGAVDVDLSVLDAHADPAQLRMSGPQDDVTL